MVKLFRNNTVYDDDKIGMFVRNSRPVSGQGEKVISRARSIDNSTEFESREQDGWL